jgi:CubicO group peptidase (beta-lactamase class C family)
MILTGSTKGGPDILRRLAIGVALIILWFAGVLHVNLAHAVTFPGTSWATRTPSQVGLNRSKLDEFRNATGNIAGVVIKDGYLIYTWGSASGKFDWASAAKPVHSTMLLFALKEEKIPSVHDQVRNWGWNLNSKDQTMELFHLANMTSGYALPEAPGERWGYNDYAIQLYTRTLYERIFEQTANTAARHSARLGRLQFQDGSIFSSRQGVGLYTSPRDFARIGWLWLNKGNWQGRQLLPASYFTNYFKPHVPASLSRTAGGTDDYLNIGSFGGGTNQTPFGPGIYGFNFWFNPNRETWPDVPVDVYQANGHWNGEVLTVFPTQNMVVVWKGRRATSSNFAGPMNNHLKLLMQAAGSM